MVRVFNPLDNYPLTHPEQYAKNTSAMTAGVATAFANPYAAVKTVVDVGGWNYDPGRILGR